MQDAEVRIFYDNDVTSRLLKVIRGAEKHLALVSPYVEQVGHVEQALLQAKERGIEITVVVRKDGLTLGGNTGKEAVSWFSRQSIPVLGVPNLHAKFYLNDSEGVVTSMNLLRSSWTNSLEFGVSVSGAEHRTLVTYFGELKRLAKAANSETVVGPRNDRARTDPPTPRTVDDKAPSGALGTLFRVMRDMVAPVGYCIRCGERLSPDDVKKGNALCAPDYRTWVRHSNAAYPEKFCADCGKPATTSYAKPRCNDCYFKA